MQTPNSGPSGLRLRDLGDCREGGRGCSRRGSELISVCGNGRSGEGVLMASVAGAAGASKSRGAGAMGCAACGTSGAGTLMEARPTGGPDGLDGAGSVGSITAMGWAMAEHGCCGRQRACKARTCSIV